MTTTDTETHAYQQAADTIRERLEAVQESAAALHPSVTGFIMDPDVPFEFIQLFILGNPFLYEAVIDTLERAAKSGETTEALDNLAFAIAIAP